MKRLLMICCMLTATYALSYGQTAINGQQAVGHSNPQANINPAIREVPVAPTQADFIKKTTQLDALLGANNTTEAQKSFDEAKTMMEAQFRSDKIRLHQPTTTEEEKKNYATEFQAQYAIYRDVMKMRDNITGNRTEIVAKLKEFATKLK